MRGAKSKWLFHFGLSLSARSSLIYSPNYWKHPNSSVAIWISTFFSEAQRPKGKKEGKNFKQNSLGENLSRTGRKNRLAKQFDALADEKCKDVQNAKVKHDEATKEATMVLLLLQHCLGGVDWDIDPLGLSLCFWQSKPWVCLPRHQAVMQTLGASQPTLYLVRGLQKKFFCGDIIVRQTFGCFPVCGRPSQYIVLGKCALRVAKTLFRPKCS